MEKIECQLTTQTYEVPVETLLLWLTAHSKPSVNQVFMQLLDGVAFLQSEEMVNCLLATLQINQAAL